MTRRNTAWVDRDATTFTPPPVVLDMPDPFAAHVGVDWPQLLARAERVGVKVWRNVDGILTRVDQAPQP